jgi:hypothetical protein
MGTPNLRSLDFDGIDQRIFVPSRPQFQLTHRLTLKAFVYVRPIISPNFAGRIMYRGDDRGALDPYAWRCRPTATLNFD